MPARSCALLNVLHLLHLRFPQIPPPPPPYSTPLKQSLSKSNTFLISLSSGTLSGSISSLVCAPLDIVKTRLQIAGTLPTIQEGVIGTLKNIVKKDGPRGLFRGLAPTLVTVPTFWGFYFPIYEEFKFFYSPYFGGPGMGDGAVCHVFSAVSAGMVADFVTNPMWVVRTRMQTETLHLLVNNENRRAMSMIETTKSLYSTHGPSVFWRGLTASFLGLSHVAIQFPVYEKMKVWLPTVLHPERGEEEPVDWLLASAASKVTACLLTYPHEVIRSR
ncbi:hypothetical protein TL16_g03213 [Triparma laevis f. inornata]|uniref:Uncharacterized protein n=1 Tax=Triparma laevis f. inornata TaxID=1714386 RepID=A0A9W6ZZF6_9STRA|nr:hypothetical protein TL16_g03213 [Triparma laevis f. inornata]